MQIDLRSILDHNLKVQKCDLELIWILHIWW